MSRDTWPASTADLCDVMGEQARIVSLPWMHFGRLTAFRGPAATFMAADDTLLIRTLLERPGESRVLVIDNAESRAHAVFGDHFGALLRDNGWAGAVINGYIRDAMALGRLPIGVVALGTTPRRPHKHGAGEEGVTLVVADVPIRPQDWITVDADGVVVVTSGSQT